MADEIQSNINININTSGALESIKQLQNQISAFHTQMAQMGAANAAQSANMRQNLINSINASGQFAASVVKIKTTTESFTEALEKNKLSLGEYFRYAGASTRTFGKMFGAEFDTINKVARERVKTLATQYIKLGRDANGAMQAIKVRPLLLDMESLATKTAIAAQRQQLLNQLLKQGSTNLLNFGKNTQWAGRQLMVGFTIPLTIMGGAAMKAYQQIEEAGLKLRRVYGDFSTTAQETEKIVKQVQQLATEFTKYGVAVKDTMDMAATAAATGKKGADLLQQVSNATKLSVLGQVDQAKALETTISLTNAFGIAAKDLKTNIDFLNAVENQTILNIEDMTTAIPKAAPVVKQLGGDVKDLAFFMTAMKEGGINASEGANALKSGLASLINPTGKAAEMLQGFGINIKKIVEGNQGDLKKTVIDFAKALDTLDPLNRARAIEQLFGKFQFSRMSTLFQNVVAQGTQAAEVLKLAGQSSLELSMLSQRELNKIQSSPLYKFQKSIADFQAQLAPIGEQFMKAVTPIIEFGSNILKQFNGLGDGVKQFIVKVVAVAGVIGPVLLMTFGLIANGVANIIKGFALVKDLFNKTGKSSLSLGEQVRYMTEKQLEAASVAASLDQTHSKLRQTFSLEADAVNKLTAAYRSAVAAQQAFNVPIIPRTPTAGRKAFAEGGIVRGPGTGTSDSILARLSNGEAVIPAQSVAKHPQLINQLIAGNVPGYARGIAKVKVPQMMQGIIGPLSQRATESLARTAITMEEISAGVLAGPLAKMKPTNYGTQISPTTGHSFPAFGVGGIYQKPDGTMVFVKPQMDLTSARAEMRGTKIARDVHGLVAPQQKLAVMMDPTDPEGKRRFIVLESPLDDRLANVPKTFTKDEYFTQLVASLLRGDKDLGLGNLGGNILADVGPAGVFTRASGARQLGGAINSMEQQAIINLLGTKGGAKKFFAQATSSLVSGMSPTEYDSRMKAEIDRVLPRLRKTISEFSDLTPEESLAYRQMIARLEDGRNVDWTRFQSMHSAVPPVAFARGGIVGGKKFNFTKPKASIFDIDDTLVHTSELIESNRAKNELLPKDQRLKWYKELANNPKGMEKVIERLKLAQGRGNKIILMTARPESYRAATLETLRKIGIDPKDVTIIFRKDKDYRKPEQMKYEKTAKYMQWYDIEEFYDDMDNTRGAVGLMGINAINPLKLARGGIVRGPGGPRDDMVPANLSNGEAVIDAETTRRNPRIIQALFAGRKINIPGYKDNNANTFNFEIPNPGFQPMSTYTNAIALHSNDANTLLNLGKAPTSMLRQELQDAGGKILAPIVHELASILGNVSTTKEINQYIKNNPQLIDLANQVVKDLSDELAGMPDQIIGDEQYSKMFGEKLRARASSLGQGVKDAAEKLLTDITTVEDTTKKRIRSGGRVASVGRIQTIAGKVSYRNKLNDYLSTAGEIFPEGVLPSDPRLAHVTKTPQITSIEQFNELLAGRKLTGQAQEMQARLAAGKYEIYKEGSPDKVVSVSQEQINAAIQAQSAKNKKVTLNQILKQEYEAGMAAGTSFASGKDKALNKEQNDSAVQSRSKRRRSPHPTAAQDGRDDGVAYAKAKDQAIAQTQSQNARKRQGRRVTREENLAGGVTIMNYGTGEGYSTIPQNYFDERKQDIAKKRGRLTDKLLERLYPVGEKGELKSVYNMNPEERAMLSRQRASSMMNKGFMGSMAAGMASMIPGPIGQVAGIASMVLGVGSMAAGPLAKMSVALQGNIKGLSLVTKNLMRFVPVIGTAILAFEAFDKLILPIIKKNADAFAAIAETLNITKDKVDKINNFFGTEIQLTGIRSMVVASGEQTKAQASIAQQFRESQEFKDIYQADAQKLKGLTQAEFTRAMQAYATDLFGQGMEDDQVRAIIDAIALEADKASVKIAPKLFSIKNPEAKAQMNKNINEIFADISKASSVINKGVLKPEGRVSQAAKGEFDNYYLTPVDPESVQKIKAGTSEIASYMSALSGQFANGEISSKQFNIQYAKLIELSKTSLGTSGIEAITSALYMLNKEAGSAIANLNDVQQAAVISALLSGVTPTEKSFDILFYGTEEQKQQQTQNFIDAEKKIQERTDKANQLNNKIKTLEKSTSNIDKIEKAINDKYDARIKQIEKIKRLNDQIAESQRGQLDLALALAEGDVTAAARAAQELQKTDIQNALENQQQALQDARDAELKPLNDTQEANTTAIQGLTAQIDKLNRDGVTVKEAEGVTGVITSTNKGKYDAANNILKNINPVTSVFENIQTLFNPKFWSSPSGFLSVILERARGFIPSNKVFNPRTGQLEDAREQNPEPQTNAAGGYISGPGSGTSDSIPAMLSNGEYVIRANAVKTIGTDVLDKLNYADRMKFANGGMVRGYDEGGSVNPNDDKSINKYKDRISKLFKPLRREDDPDWWDYTSGKTVMSYPWQWSIWSDSGAAGYEKSNKSGKPVEGVFAGSYFNRYRTYDSNVKPGKLLNEAGIPFDKDKYAKQNPLDVIEYYSKLLQGRRRLAEYVYLPKLDPNNTSLFNSVNGPDMYMFATYMKPFFNPDRTSTGGQNLDQLRALNKLEESMMIPGWNGLNQGEFKNLVGAMHSEFGPQFTKQAMKSLGFGERYQNLINPKSKGSKSDYRDFLGISKNIPINSDMYKSAYNIMNNPDYPISPVLQYFNPKLGTYSRFGKKLGFANGGMVKGYDQGGPVIPDPFSDTSNWINSLINSMFNSGGNPSGFLNQTAGQGTKGALSNIGQFYKDYIFDPSSPIDYAMAFLPGSKAATKVAGKVLSKFKYPLALDRKKVKITGGRLDDYTLLTNSAGATPGAFREINGELYYIKKPSSKTQEFVASTLWSKLGLAGPKLQTLGKNLVASKIIPNLIYSDADHLADYLKSAKNKDEAAETLVSGLRKYFDEDMPVNALLGNTDTHTQNILFNKKTGRFQNIDLGQTALSDQIWMQSSKPKGLFKDEMMTRKDEVVEALASSGFDFKQINNLLEKNGIGKITKNEFEFGKDKWAWFDKQDVFSAIIPNRPKSGKPITTKDITPQINKIAKTLGFDLTKPIGSKKNLAAINPKTNKFVASMIKEYPELAKVLDLKTYPKGYLVGNITLDQGLSQLFNRLQGALKDPMVKFANGGMVRGYDEGGEVVPPSKIDKAMSDRWQNMGRVFGPLTPGQGFDMNNVPGLLREITGSKYLTESEKWILGEYVARPKTLLNRSIGFSNMQKEVGKALIRNKFKIDAGTNISRVGNHLDSEILKGMKPGQSVILDRFMSIVNDNHPTSKSFIQDMITGKVDTGGRTGGRKFPIIKFNLKTDVPGINDINHLIPGVSNVSDGLLAPGAGMKLIKVRYEKGVPVYYFDVGTNIKAKYGLQQLDALKGYQLSNPPEDLSRKYKRLRQDWYQEVKNNGPADDSGIIKYIKSNGNAWSRSGGGGGGGMLTNFGMIMSQLFADGGLVRGYAMGGQVSPINFTRNGLTYPKLFANGGLAMGTDTVPAMLTPGEFVIKKSAVERIGASTLNQINRFADGGMVGGGSSSASTSIGDSVYNYSISVNVSSQSDPNQIARVVMNEIKKIDNHRVRGSSF